MFFSSAKVRFLQVASDRRRIGPGGATQVFMELDNFFIVRYARAATYDGTAAKCDAIQLRVAVPEKYRNACSGQEAIAAFAAEAGGARVSGSTLAREMAVRRFDAKHERLLKNVEVDGNFFSSAKVRFFGGPDVLKT